MRRRFLPRSLRKQFLLAVGALAALMVISGITAVYTLSTSSSTIRQLADERLARMQQTQDLVQHTLLIERESYELANASSLAQMHASYEELIGQLEVADKQVAALAQESDAGLVMELHQSSQLFRNTAHIAAQVKEAALQGDRSANEPRSPTTPPYGTELHRQAGAMVASAQALNQQHMAAYRDSVQQLTQRSRDTAIWMGVLLAFKLLLAWAIAHLFLGQHVLARLQRVSSSLRIRQEDAAPAADAADDELDEMARAVALFQEDRQQLAQRTSELILARDAAEAANKAKSVFLANMSHELRTPLNAILGFSSLMSEAPELTPSQRQNLSIINRSGQHLLTLINDVLEMAKIEAGRLQLEVRPFDLGDMVREVTEMMRLRAEERGLALFLDQSSAFPRYVRGDPARLRQILINLISNAVKFTDEGSVSLRLGVRSNSRNHLVLEVEDTGAGIAEKDQPHLFEPFVQLGRGAERGGSGLGLSITRQFVELMGGTIAVRSALGKGTSMRVELPLELPSDAEIVELTVPEDLREVEGLAPGQPRYRILIAEDQPENQILLSRLMTGIDFEVKLVANGEECVEAFRIWHPDLIWMDRHMPVMDGVEATRRIRELPEGKRVKIVAVTASAFKEQQQELMDAGMDDFVAKPYRFAEIYACLARQLGVRYVYRMPKATDPGGAVALVPSALKALSADVRAGLRAAAEALDMDSMNAVIAQISSTDRLLGRALSHHARNFNYAGILAALDAE